MKRGCQGPWFCTFYMLAEETSFHLFLNFQISQQLWKILENWYGFQHLSHSSIIDASTKRYFDTFVYYHPLVHLEVEKQFYFQRQEFHLSGYFIQYCIHL